jgi:uncharacterized delta-60 repeat protein
MLQKFTLPFLIMVVMNLTLFSQSGTLVSSFGINGETKIRFKHFRFNDDYGGTVLTDKYHKIVLMGTSSTDSTRKLCLIRINSNGSLDTSFNHTGKMAIPAATGIDFIKYPSIALDPEGRILIAGEIDSEMISLIRLNRDGNIDTTFGANGKLKFSAYSENFGYCALIQRNNKITLAFESKDDTGTCILRITDKGKQDMNFGNNGELFFHTDSFKVSSVIDVDSENRILTVGKGNLGKFFCQRLDSTGASDNTFGVNGKIYFQDLNHSNQWISVKSDPENKIIIVHTAVLTERYLKNYMRFNEDGTYDSTFKSTIDRYTFISGPEIGFDSIGRILLSGYAERNPGNYNYRYSIASLKHDGSLDSTFNSDGIYWSSAYMYSDLKYTVNCSVLDENGSILFAGTQFNVNNMDFIIERINKHGISDSTFNGTGKVFINGDDQSKYIIKEEESAATSLIMDHSGRIIMAGYSRNTNEGISPETYDYCIVRLDADGNPDLTFNNSGSILIPALNDYPAVPQIACDENNKILISGIRLNGYFLQRFNENGNPDTAFGSNGTVLFSDLYPSERVLIDIDPTGRIWLFMEGGYLYDCIFRLTPDGLRDTLFNGTGQVGTRNLAISKIYRSDNGDLYVLGSFPLDDAYHPKVLIINDRGIIDTIMAVKIKRFETTGANEFSSRYYIEGSGGNSAGEEIKLKSIGSSRTSWMNACMNDSIFITVSSYTWGANWSSTLYRGIIRETPDTTFTRDVKTETLYGRHCNAMVADCDYFWLAGQDSSETCFVVTKHYARDSQTIDFFLPDTMYVGDPPLNLTGETSSGLPVTYSGSNTDVAMISYNTLTILGEGNVTITASQAGDGNFYAAEPVIRNLVVKGNITVIPTHEPEKEIKTYPNPVSDILCLESPRKIKSVVITDLEGYVIYKNSLVNETYLSLDLSEFKAGCYLITVQLDNNSPGLVRKIIKL